MRLLARSARMGFRVCRQQSQSTGRPKPGKVGQSRANLEALSDKHAIRTIYIVANYGWFRRAWPLSRFCLVLKVWCRKFWPSRSGLQGLAFKVWPSRSGLKILVLTSGRQVRAFNPVLFPIRSGSSSTPERSMSRQSLSRYRRKTARPAPRLRAAIRATRMSD